MPSASEFDRAWAKFKAFMPAKLSEKAKAENAWHYKDWNDAGWFFMRSALAGSSYEVLFGDLDGTRLWCNSNNINAGLRVALNLIYNPECTLVKGCEWEKRTVDIYENGDRGPVYDGNGHRTQVISEAPIVTLGNGTKCIWLNKEECEEGHKAGKKVAMELWTLYLVERAVPFDEENNNNDYAKADKIQAQCETWLNENLTDEEKAMIVEVEMSSEDGYEKATPILENEDEM